MAQYEWSEIFTSIEGEGRYSGSTTIYVRFSRCNFKCALFNNPNNKIENTGYAPLGFEPKHYTSLQSIPLITRGCDSQYAVNPEFSHMWHKGDENKLTEEVIKVLPHNTFVNPTSGKRVILSLSVHEDENVLALENNQWMYKPIKQYWDHDNTSVTINDGIEQQHVKYLYCHVFDNGNISVKPVSKLYRHKVDKVHKITTQMKYSIRVTESHSLMVINKQGNIEHKRCSEIVKGDY